MPTGKIFFAARIGLEMRRNVLFLGVADVFSHIYILHIFVSMPVYIYIHISLFFVFNVYTPASRSQTLPQWRPSHP